MYDTKKIMKALSMDYEKIDVCPKNCLLFRHQYADDKYCRKCGSSRYIEVVGEDGEKKQLTIPVKVLRYLDFIKRLQRLFITKESAKMMKWHKEGIRYNPKKSYIHRKGKHGSRSMKNTPRKQPRLGMSE